MEGDDEILRDDLHRSNSAQDVDQTQSVSAQVEESRQTESTSTIAPIVPEHVPHMEEMTEQLQRYQMAMDIMKKVTYKEEMIKELHSQLSRDKAAINIFTKAEEEMTDLLQIAKEAEGITCLQWQQQNEQLRQELDELRKASKLDVMKAKQEMLQMVQDFGQMEKRLAEQLREIKQRQSGQMCLLKAQHETIQCWMEEAKISTEGLKHNITSSKEKLEEQRQHSYKLEMLRGIALAELAQYEEMIKRQTQQ